MALNPFREHVPSAGGGPRGASSPFQGEAQASLAAFRQRRAQVVRQVREGEITVQHARRQAAEAAAAMKAALLERTASFSPTPALFRDRLIQAQEARQAARARPSAESLQRESNRLLQQLLLEQQLGSRREEFEGRAFARSIGGGPPGPTLESLIRFHDEATSNGDESGREWARRQLEGMRSRIIDEVDQKRIDQVCDRPDRVNPRVVERYVETLRNGDEATMRQFVEEAVRAEDASACCAAFVVAREQPGATEVPWVRGVIEKLGLFPEPAIAQLCQWENQARQADAEAAQSVAIQTAALAEAEARLHGLEAPSDAEIQRTQRARTLPHASADEPIGLGLVRRGLSAEEFEALSQTPNVENTIG